MSNQYKDEFSDAETELDEKSAYVCDSCNAKYKKEEAQKRGNTCCGRTVTNFSKNLSTR